MFSKVDKAFAALVVGGLVPLLNHLFGWEISPEVQQTAVAILGGLFVYFIPNKP